MKPTIYVLLLALLINACGPIRNLQKVETRIPCLGSIGKSNSTLFTKDFEKAGEPALNSPLEVSLNVFDFSNATLAKYRKYQEIQGDKNSLTHADSTQMELPKYYQLRISDLVGLSAQLNAARNQTLKAYLQDDVDLGILTGISFVAQGEIDNELRNAEHFFLKEHRGAIILEAHKGQHFVEIKMASLEVFDFETSHLCWKLDKRNKLEIAAVLAQGTRCPGETEKDPNKLDTTKSYLKL